MKKFTTQFNYFLILEPCTTTEHEDNTVWPAAGQCSSAVNTPESSGNISFTRSENVLSVCCRIKSGFSGICLPLRSHVSSTGCGAKLVQTRSSGSPSSKFWLSKWVRKPTVGACCATTTSRWQLLISMPSQFVILHEYSPSSLDSMFWIVRQLSVSLVLTLNRLFKMF